MYDIQTIETAFNGQVGLRQSFDSSQVQLTRLTDAVYFIQDVHALLTVENLVSICPDFDKMTLTESKGEVFTKWVERKANASLGKVLNEWRGLKLANESARTLIERKKLFRPEVGNSDTVTKTTSFAGLEFVVTESMNIALVIEKIGLQFDTDQPIKIYLFRDGEKTAIQSKTLAYAGSGGVQWFALDWKATDAGKYFLVYDESDVAGNAINGIFASDHLASGSRWVYANHFSVSGMASKKTEVQGIGVMDIEGTFIVTNGDVSQTWDPGEALYNVGSNYGLNAEVSIVTDYTGLIVGRKSQFAYPWALRLGCDLLRELIYNPNSRINRAEFGIDKKMVLYEIDGDSSVHNKTGLLADYSKALKSISFDQSLLDPVTMPKKRRGIRHRSKG